MKMFNVTVLAGLALVSSGLAGCDANGGYGGGFDNATLGTGLGALAGGAVGANFGKGNGRIATGLGGALLGGIAGNLIARRLSPQDQPYYGQAQQQAYSAPVGQTVTWVNPNSGSQGAITPTNEGYTDQGYCREYQQTITVGGQTQRAYGKACRQPDGSWRVIS